MLADVLTQKWTVLLARGVVAVVFGIIAMAAPITAALSLVLLWGLWALVDGIGALVHALTSGTVAERLLMAGLGVVALFAAVVAITSPQMTAVALTWILGVWLAVRGVVEIVTAVVTRGEGWPALIGLGLLDGVLGVLLMANPGSAAIGIAWFIGLLALVWGIVLVGLAVATRSAQRGAGARPAGPAGPADPGVPAGGTP
jgi:uncharacterized membrane protein HdeD (DUF308 family)